MSHYDLSILIPGIRTQNWERLIKSFDESIPGLSWEAIFIGPYELPLLLQTRKNIKYIKDWGSPNRCQQIGLQLVEGDYLTWIADDGVMLPGTVEKAIELVTPTNMIAAKYYEGEGSDHIMEDPNYYKMGYHGAFNGLPQYKDYIIANTGILKTATVIEHGGWDAENFEATAIAHMDFAIRLQNAGIKIQLYDKPMYRCSHMPGISGDHGPIFYAQTQNDEPKLTNIHNREAKRVVWLDNWKSAPPIWTRRFSK